MIVDDHILRCVPLEGMNTVLFFLTSFLISGLYKKKKITNQPPLAANEMRTSVVAQLFLSSRT